LICATIFCPPWRYGRAGYQTAEEAWQIAQEQIACYEQWTAEGLLEKVTKRGELKLEGGKTKYILLLEGADAIREADDVGRLYEQGVRIVGLSWRKNRMAGGTGFPGGISGEGKEVVRAMDRLKMIHDASHLADEAFWELLEMTDGPVMASHSNCRAIVPGDRQLSDEMIKALVEREGVIGMNFYDQFLMRPGDYKKRKCTMEDLLAHVRHICELAGNARHVALGTDMDGGVGRDEIPQEMGCISELYKVGDALSAMGMSDGEVAGIMSGNWMRYLAEHLPD
ncbi:MAG TPA: membrane dipeptidase, partial [Tepidisphaeraceae bacterium]|jgi:membrane dipeptidase|nr:membrane dipeptidase [Tepidisphaeraceae bacterium]